MSAQDRDRAPDREQVEAKLADLASGKITREEAAAWADRYDLDAINDESVFDALELLAGADMISTDRPYLYGPEDFRAWLAEFRRSIAANEAA